MEGITQYRTILDAMEGNMKTDMSFNDMQKIALDYRSAFTTIDQLQMQGDGFMQDGVSYQRVSDEELQSVQNKLKKQLDTK